MITEERQKKEKEKGAVCGQAIHGGNAVHQVAGPVGEMMMLWAGKVTTGKGRQTVDTQGCLV